MKHDREDDDEIRKTTGRKDPALLEAVRRKWEANVLGLLGQPVVGRVTTTWVVGRPRKPPYLFAIVQPDGLVMATGWTSHDAWCKFFTSAAYRLPIADAIKAYEGIGYRLVKFNLVESRFEEDED